MKEEDAYQMTGRIGCCPVNGFEVNDGSVSYLNFSSANAPTFNSASLSAIFSLASLKFPMEEEHGMVADKLWCHSHVRSTTY
jgi:hypothetical protein